MLIIKRPGYGIRPKFLDMVVGKREVARGDAEVPKRFPTPRGATWKEIEIDIDSGETIVVRTRGVTRKYHASDVGFRDNRMVDRFTGQWELMEAFAQNGGRIGWGSGGARKRWHKDIQKLNKLLRTFFGLSSNPIARYSRKDGWVAKFQIRDTSYGKS